MKLKQAYATETYISDGGYFCISQESRSDESIVVLTPSQMKLLIDEMQFQLFDTGWFLEKIEE